MDDYGGYEIERMHWMEDDMYDSIESPLDEWDCIDMGCSHFDGDMCTLGGCYDPDPSPDWLAEQDRWAHGDYLSDLEREEG